MKLLILKVEIKYKGNLQVICLVEKNQRINLT